MDLKNKLQITHNNVIVYQDLLYIIMSIMILLFFYLGTDTQDFLPINTSMGIRVIYNYGIQLIYKCNNTTISTNNINDINISILNNQHYYQQCHQYWC